MFGVVECAGGPYIVLEDREGASPAYIQQGAGCRVAGSGTGKGEDLDRLAGVAEPSGGVGKVGKDSGSEVAVVGAVG
ncbi:MULTISPECIES: hypothetical protein [unclassified Streptomyces]|uniref:hypothetical protein n=1 Tax=unclassified Streptomyces TaxID=2593676 RepID=UPI000AE7F0B5|nr:MULTISPECIES: hypothetical protein [unclassified Streptomyces]